MMVGRQVQKRDEPESEGEVMRRYELALKCDEETCHDALGGRCNSVVLGIVYMKAVQQRS